MELVVRERKWMKVREVSKQLGLSEPRVYQMIGEGEIPGAYRTGKRALRIDHEEFSRWLEGRREGQER